MVLQYDPRQCLPSSAELPDSDDTPVDNELQNLIPNLLDGILAMAWPQRVDWFFGVDMGIYYDPDQPAIVPDGFLSLGVERFIGEDVRLSYMFWEEDHIPPILALEVVSKTYGGEYERKKTIYADLGIRYYAVYLPNHKSRRKRQSLEVYILENGTYQQLDGNPVWLPEIGLGLGRERGTYLGREREWLYWFNQDGDRLLTPEERVEQAESQVEQEKNRAEQAKARVERLAEKLKALGVDPDSI
ncbi:Uma2 family endonuclease [Acaryochloris sp. CCMEE 5410]|uniref:Uma2 family endonuclease n=1 Tax=Acaryochloris sp. CCMEE 5410 TaxID=310037 RepID=UPI0002DE61DB|nr:Uma2 family endonuclease [Acaryochloris sp. CCMEE 5410]KAI9135061.1 Uma2 family endonuclease [Acaryochloris sp. CCMEE 5410]